MATGPDQWLRQHVPGIAAPRVDSGAFRPGWLIRTRLDQLLFDEAIEAPVYHHAVTFRFLVERAAGRGRSVLMAFGSDGRAGDPAAMALAQRRAATRVEAIQGLLSPLDAGLSWACVVNDLSWREIGRRLTVTHETARTWTIATLPRLAQAVVASGHRAAPAGPGSPASRPGASGGPARGGAS